MSVVAADIKIFGSQSMPDTDTPTNIGGAINTAVKVEFTDISPNGTVEMLSSNAGDTTQTLTIYGRDGAGVLQSEVKTLNGTSVVSFTTTWERILKAVLSGAAAGTVTVRKASAGGDLITLEAGITQVRRPFYNAAAPAAGTRKYYEKIFFKNTHGSLALTDAVISEYADPSGKIAFALESSLDGNDTNGADNNRQVAPNGYVFTSVDKDVANSKNHTAGSGQGVWLEFTMASTDASVKTTYTLREFGITI